MKLARRYSLEKILFEAFVILLDHVMVICWSCDDHVLVICWSRVDHVMHVVVSLRVTM